MMLMWIEILWKRKWLRSLLATPIVRIAEFMDMYFHVLSSGKYPRYHVLVKSIDSSSNGKTVYNEIIVSDNLR